MPLVKTSELTGPALDWAVATIEGHTQQQWDWYIGYNAMKDEDIQSKCYAYSSWWGAGGPIIEREGMDIIHTNDSEWVWRATLFLPVPAPYNTPQEVFRFGGSTPLIAAMRCYVASRLGDTIDIPTALQN